MNPVALCNSVYPCQCLLSSFREGGWGVANNSPGTHKEVACRSGFARPTPCCKLGAVLLGNDKAKTKPYTLRPTVPLLLYYHIRSLAPLRFLQPFTYPAANSRSFDGATLHFGRCKPQKLSAPSDLLYNEYVVYDVSQIRLRYVFKMKFHYK